MNIEKLHNTLYVSDLDGTLLNEKSVLSSTTEHILQQVLAHGANFTIATARTPATVENLMRNVPISLPKIVIAGAVLWHTDSASYSHARVFDESISNRLCDIFTRFGINPFVYRLNNNEIIASHAELLSPFERAFYEPRKKSKYKQMLLSDTMPFGSKEHQPILIYVLGEYDTLEKAYNHILAENFDLFPLCYHDIFDHSKGNLEIYPKGTSKANSIETIAKELGTKRIVVFGDNLNDLPMMRSATHSVAVANAVDEIKDSAHEVIGPNTADSVARWIAADLEIEV